MNLDVLAAWTCCRHTRHSLRHAAPLALRRQRSHGAHYSVNHLPCVYYSDLDDIDRIKVIVVTEPGRLEH